MKKLPTWAKILGAILIAAILIGAAQLMLWFDRVGGSSKFGLD